MKNSHRLELNRLGEHSVVRGPQVQFLYSIALVPLFLIMAMFWPFGGGKKVDMLAGQSTPAAQGTIDIKTSQNKNTHIDLKVRALAKPSSLTPPANVYVVWIEPPGENPKNEGQLHVDKDLNGELQTEVPYKRFRIFITAEQDPQAQTPTGTQVLSADVAQS